MNKNSGILLHPTALPSKYGIGDFGPEAYTFVDNLVEMGQTYWQILPIGPSDSSNSPYSLLSTFAGNPLLISLELLIEDGLLLSNEIVDFPVLSEKVDFNFVNKIKSDILNIVCENFYKRANIELIKKYEYFCEKHSYWLEGFCKFWSLKEATNWSVSWKDWDNHLIPCDVKVEHAKIVQFIFDFQWNKLKEYCHINDIKIIGDMPIYVSYESADVWQNREIFYLEKDNTLKFKAGCPPCKYNENGQLWGNPIYNWDEHEKTQYKWWINRFKKLFEMVDVVRLDHFIGFSKYWEISASKNTAKLGKWKLGPKSKFFKVLLNNFENFNIIAEDLGDADEEVINLRNEFNFPGMHIIQFDIESNEFTKEYLYNSILYTGTHDNSTLKGWLAQHSNKLNLKNKNGELSGKVNNWDIINYVLNQKNKLTIFPIQDLIELGDEARFNKPGTFLNKNWTWRMRKNQLTSQIKLKMKDLTIKSNRHQTSITNQILTSFKEAI